MIKQATKSKQINLWLNDQPLLVDNFAGGGGASTGISLALGRQVDIAVNHDPVALSVHKANHPHTEHYIESVYDVNPLEATKGMPVGLAWFSPDCRHFSIAKGSTPVKKNIRGLAWVALKWAVLAKPNVIVLENVKEFRTWGGLQRFEKKNQDGKTEFFYKPDPAKKGEIFNGFIKKLEKAGYVVEHRLLKACDYGAPTSRERFFLIARRDNQKIVWPAKTHGDTKGLKPYRTAAECINFSLPIKSIFERPKPLVDNTLRRIAKGIFKFVINDPKPFIFEIAHYSKTKKNERVHSINEPLRTITASPKGGSFALVVPIIARQFKSGSCHRVDEPTRTLTTVGKDQLVCTFLKKYNIDEKDMIQHDHADAVSAFLIKYYGASNAASLKEPLDTITTKDRMALVTINQELYRIVDIKMRMLAPEELYAAQSFPDDYIYNQDDQGNKIGVVKQVAMCGNSVPPLLVKAIVQSNVPSLIEQRTMEAA